MPGRIEIRLAGYSYNESQGDCYDAGRYFMPADIVDNILSKYAVKNDFVNFSGSEPTRHPDFLSLINNARAKGYAISVNTKGGALADPDFAMQALGRIDELVISFSPREPLLMDKNPDIKAGLKALENIIRFKSSRNLLVNYIATRKNFTRIKNDISSLIGLGVKNLLISNVAPEIEIIQDYEDMLIPISSWKKKISSLVKLAEAKLERFKIFGLPWCAMRGYYYYLDEGLPDTKISLRSFWYQESRVKSSIINRFGPLRVQTALCQRCAAKDKCLGAFRVYIDIMGDSELSPQD